MDLDYSWSAIFRPGTATHFFDVQCPERLQAYSSDFNVTNAWWLAEISRWVYQQDSDAGGAGASGPGRRGVLEAVNLQEIRFVNCDGVQFALIQSRGPGGDKLGILVFRGTSTLRDWLSNLEALPANWPTGGLVHRGFMELWDRAWGEVDKCLAEIDYPMFFTGHSLGGALATLAAAGSRQRPWAVYTFGSPRVGDSDFAATLKGITVYRVVNNSDVVPNVPPSQAPLHFRHVGELCYITSDNRMSVGGPNRSLASSGEGSSSRLRTAFKYATWREPPQFLADHAPANYVARLERLMLQQEKTNPSNSRPDRPGQEQDQ